MPRLQIDIHQYEQDKFSLVLGYSDTHKALVLVDLIGFVELISILRITFNIRFYYGQSISADTMGILQTVLEAMEIV